MKKLFILILISITLAGCQPTPPTTSTTTPLSEENAATTPVVDSIITETEARTIAEQTCIKGGEALGNGFYNDNTKTWWFDANLNAVREGCNPACVVFEATKTAEINWRCTGLITPDESTTAVLLTKLFIEKYPEYGATISVRIDQETENHARGGVFMEPNTPGGIFLAAKIDSNWQIVFDGNGAISCDLAKYGFPTEMLKDCAI